MKKKKEELKTFVYAISQGKRKKPKVFISGSISARLDTYKKYFDEAEKKLLALNCEVYNPAILPEDTPWRNAIVETVEQLVGCDAVYVLRGYEGSKGVKVELKVAEEWDIPIFFE